MANDNEQFGCDYGKAQHIGMMILSSWAITVLMPFRRCIGPKYLACRVPFALVMPFVFSIGTKSDTVYWIIPYFFVALVFQGISKYRNRGELCHSNYSGEPYIALKFLKFKNELWAKKFVEPLILVTCGCYLLLLDPPIAMFWFGGAWAAAMTHQMQEHILKREKRQMRDTMIESMQYAEMARDLRRGLRHH